MRTHLTLELTTATLLLAAMMPTAASAFDISGLVQGAVARYAAQGYRVNLGGRAHYAGVHVASRHRHSSDEDDPDTPPSKDIGMAPHRIQDNRAVLQTTEPMKAGSAVRSDSGEPTFAPSR